jgi:hypothetical protein
MEITFENIINNAKPQSPLGGKQTLLKIGLYEVSITGGREGLYGDFETTFQVEVFDENGHVVTDKVVPSANGDVIGWVDKEHLIEIVNTIPH